MGTNALRRRALMAFAIGGAVALTAGAGRAATPEEKPVVAEAAREAVLRMGRTLSAESFSFRNRTIREYVGPGGETLHIFHVGDVVVRRPDRLLVNLTGDDGTVRLLYDGKALVAFNEDSNRYAILPAPGGIEPMLRVAAEKLRADFPLADLLAESPGQAVLSEVTAGSVIGGALVDGVPCQHLVLTQPPGIDIELWLEDNEQALPRRVIVTYRALAGAPRFIAEISDWQIGLRPPDADFVFRVPAGATRVAIGQEQAE
ncbi:exported protein of unknown function [Rhodovastum atsumiense]|uniref:DUF2092 domain-containing protein n=1 Tax=Rhodovastum atsumiense TaxID=504468 RepID=UPI00139F2B33|nr:DUF2092 domain-containing protein [Rhodovastum atsumiense]CAH2602322.1 exported protein of unknown function [Rhodovastum atsumiense]